MLAPAFYLRPVPVGNGFEWDMISVLHQFSISSRREIVFLHDDSLRIGKAVVSTHCGVPSVNERFSDHGDKAVMAGMLILCGSTRALEWHFFGHLICLKKLHFILLYLFRKRIKTRVKRGVYRVSSVPVALCRLFDLILKIFTRDPFLLCSKKIGSILARRWTNR